MEKLAGKLAPALALLLLTVSLLSPAISLAEHSKRSAGQDLHRADFRVEGASCVTCLRRIASTLRATRGVIKADISIYRPYWAIVIYDKKQTSIEKMNEAVKSEHIKMAELEDKSIPQVPAVIIPKGLTDLNKTPAQTH